MIFLYLLISPIAVPVMFLFHLICRLAWKPDVKMPNHGPADKTLTTADFSDDWSGYKIGDGAKFIGQWYAANGTEELWEEVKKYWDFDELQFVRDEERDTAFSGDMMAGMVLAIAFRDREGKLTKEEKDFLGAMSWRLIMNGLPFKFKHEDSSRGYFWHPFSPGLNCIYQAFMVMNWGKRFHKHKFKRIFLNILSKIIFVLNLPIILFGMFDHNIFVGKTYACWWYGTHSDALTFAAAQLTKIPLAKRQLKALYNRYVDINADIAALGYALIGASDNNELYEVHSKIFSMVTDLKKSRDVSELPTNKIKYYSLRDLLSNIGNIFKTFVGIFTSFDIKAFVKAVTTVHHISKMREDTFNGGKQCQDRTWERNQQNRGWSNSNLGDLDAYFPLAMIELNQKERFKD